MLGRARQGRAWQDKAGIFHAGTFSFPRQGWAMLCMAWPGAAPQDKDLSRLTKQEKAETIEDLEETLAEMDDWDAAYKARPKRRKHNSMLRQQVAATTIDEKARGH